MIAQEALHFAGSSDRHLPTSEFPPNTICERITQEDWVVQHNMVHVVERLFQLLFLTRRQFILPISLSCARRQKEHHRQQRVYVLSRTQTISRGPFALQVLHICINVLNSLLRPQSCSGDIEENCGELMSGIPKASFSIWPGKPACCG